MYRLIAALALALLTGCGGGVYRDRQAPITSIAAFDLTRYGGTWYEIARFPVPFQRGCTDVTARYTPLPEGGVEVVNTCLRDGEVRQVRGDAVVTRPGRLGVRFSGVPIGRAPYWVLWVDEGYRTAVVGVPSGRAGWILNRSPEIPEDRLNAALQVLEFNGYDVSQLARTPHGVQPVSRTLSSM
ncbi:MAG: lipocalin family protein [Pseudomonadota bacterium]